MYLIYFRIVLSKIFLKVRIFVEINYNGEKLKIKILEVNGEGKIK